MPVLGPQKIYLNFDIADEKSNIVTNDSINTILGKLTKNTEELININLTEVKATADNTKSAVDSINLKKLETANEGAIASYQLMINDSIIGETIDIPKDLVISSGEIKTVDTADTPVTGYVIGDKYIDLVIANSDDEHIYILVSDLVYNLPIASNTTLGGVKIDNDSITIDGDGVISGIGQQYYDSATAKGEIFNDYTNNVASGEYSHAEGYKTNAQGDYSHAEGIGTIAYGNNQHVQGKYNITSDDPNDYAFIIGNGESDKKRSNALTVDWDGVVTANKFVVNSTAIKTITANEELKPYNIYNLGELTDNITFTLPNTGSAYQLIKLTFAIPETVYTVTTTSTNTTYNLETVANTYYNILFEYDEGVNEWVEFIITRGYIHTAE